MKQPPGGHMQAWIIHDILVMAPKSQEGISINNRSYQEFSQSAQKANSGVAPERMACLVHGGL